jgi:surfactin synthase thioesterase subunit
LRFAQPCVFYGHSFGAHVAFCLAQRLWQLALPIPQLLVASGEPDQSIQIPHTCTGEHSRLCEPLGGFS